MSDLKTTFAGLQLKNPIIISSSGLTNSADKVKKLEMAGAGAVVLKSLFEEQIMLQAEQMQDATYLPEGTEYIANYVRAHNLAEYIKLIEECKHVCQIPIIASINCYSNNEWADFAKEIELAGANAIELNILSVQVGLNHTFGEFEQRHIDILQHVKKNVNIPVIMKLGNNLTAPVSLINQLYANGAAAVVLFNRFYQPDINIDKLEYTSGDVFSTPSDLSTSLRWIGISSATVNQLDYAASGGIHDGESVVKAILAGASAIEVCSCIYQRGSQWIEPMKTAIRKWMIEKGYKEIKQFKGLMNANSIKGINNFERTQFLKYFAKHE